MVNVFLPVLNLFHIAFVVVFLVCFLIYVPSKHVACGSAALCSSDLFVKRRVDGLTSLSVSIDVSSQASFGFF